MKDLPAYITISLLDIPGDLYRRREGYGKRKGDVQTLYRCSPGERTTILKAASVLGLSGAEFTRTVMIQAASAVFLDGVETSAKTVVSRRGPVRLSAAVAPGAKK